MSDRQPVRAALIAAALAVVMMLTGCSLLPGSDNPESGPTCGDQDWCYTIEPVEGAYRPSMSSLYCVVAQVRKRVVSGSVDLDQLPRWANRTFRNGAPIVIDMATIPTDKVDQRNDQLQVHFKRKLGKPINFEKMVACSDELTQREIEATDGKRTAE